MKSEHYMRVCATVDDNGVPGLCGVVFANLPNAKLIGNGTCPHPLSIALSGPAACADELVALLKEIRCVSADRELVPMIDAVLAKVAQS